MASFEPGMPGLLSLAGVIINNDIVLIDKIDSDRAEGIAPHAAIVNAALSRFRPILMTTVTTVLGLLPLILSLDPLFFSMAVILAFGLIFGTILSIRKTGPTVDGILKFNVLNY